MSICSYPCSFVHPHTTDGGKRRASAASCAGLGRGAASTQQREAARVVGGVLTSVDGARKAVGGARRGGGRCLQSGVGGARRAVGGARSAVGGACRVAGRAFRTVGGARGEAGST